MGYVTYVGWATNSRAIIITHLYVFKKKKGVITSAITVRSRAILNFSEILHYLMDSLVLDQVNKVWYFGCIFSLIINLYILKAFSVRKLACSASSSSFSLLVSIAIYASKQQNPMHSPSSTEAQKNSQWELRFSNFALHVLCVWVRIVNSLFQHISFYHLEKEQTDLEWKGEDRISTNKW